MLLRGEGAAGHRENLRTGSGGNHRGRFGIEIKLMLCVDQPGVNFRRWEAQGFPLPGIAYTQNRYSDFPLPE